MFTFQSICFCQFGVPRSQHTCNARGPELRASTKPGFRTELACSALESSCRSPADADRRASKTQFLKSSENRVRSHSQRAVCCGSRHARRRPSSHLGLAWIMSELPTRALRISSTFERSAADVRLADRRRAAVWTSKTLVTCRRKRPIKRPTQRPTQK